MNDLKVKIVRLDPVSAYEFNMVLDNGSVFEIDMRRLIGTAFGDLDFRVGGTLVKVGASEGDVAAAPYLTRKIVRVDITSDNVFHLILDDGTPLFFSGTNLHPPSIGNSLVMKPNGQMYIKNNRVMAEVAKESSGPTLIRKIVSISISPDNVYNLGLEDGESVFFSCNNVPPPSIGDALCMTCRQDNAPDERYIGYGYAEAMAKSNYESTGRGITSKPVPGGVVYGVE